MNSYIRRTPMLAAALLFGACDTQSIPTDPVSSKIPSSASRSVERMVEEYLFIMDGTFVGFICADGTESELVALEGKIYNRNVVTINPAGAIIATSHSMPVGLRGVGTVTGQEYRVKEQEHLAVSQRETGYAGTLRQVFELTGRESMETFKLVTISRYTVNAKGELVVEREKVRTECAS